MTSIKKDYSHLPVLHPDRLRQAIQTLQYARQCDTRVENSDVLATCEAAVRLVRKGQLAAGLTGAMVDTVSDGVGLVRAVAGVITKFKAVTK